MALIFDSDAYSRKSRRHGTSGRRRTTTNYDKYGYQVTTLGSSSHSTGSDIMHVLRVRPGVVVNLIEPQSSSSRSRPRTSSHTVEHRSNYKSSRHRGTDDERESSWEMTHSPHPRALEIFDDSNHFGMVDTEPPPRELPIMRQSPPSPPSPHFPPETQYPVQHYESHREQSARPRELPIMRQSPPSPPSPHFPPETQYPVQPYESRREQSSPIDIPNHSRSSDFALQSPSTISSISDSPPTHYDQAIQPYYYAPRHTPGPIDMPIQISSGRNLSRSFEYPSHSMHSSESSSPPSATRTVRFNEDPVQRSPSPVVRRKGWWNKRGDQLWDNDGGYARASDHDKYPLDLQNYPESGVGWMNEDGVQIDMKRRIVRKKPLRSALKKSSSL